MGDKRDSDDIEKQLSVGRFAAQEAKTMGFTFGGAILGGLAGLGLGKAGLARFLPQQVGAAGNRVIAGAGAVIGLMVGSVASMYEHWAKVERERLSVKEINKDVASIMEKRVQFENTLEQQQAIIDGMLKQQEVPGPMTSKELARREVTTTSERSV